MIGLGCESVRVVVISDLHLDIYEPMCKVLDMLA